jgi:hypothetical protein
VAPGGAESQRWYTFDGNVASGQPGATFALYRNTGGNFNALPVTAPVQVGTVALALINCNAATMTYAFTDGSNRSGTIPLQRITPNVTCSENASRSTDPDFGYSGNWYDPATSGQGLMLEVNPKASAVFLPGTPTRPPGNRKAWPDSAGTPARATSPQARGRYPLRCTRRPAGFSTIRCLHPAPFKWEPRRSR